MKNTPGFVLHGPNMGLQDREAGDRMEVHAVVMHLARHGDDQVEECLDDESFAQTFEVLKSGNRIIMGSKSWMQALPVEPFDSLRSHYCELLTLPGSEALIPTEGGPECTQVRCHTCGAICQGPVEEDGCNMCAFEVDDDPYNECDCEISGGFENHRTCLLHMASKHTARTEDMRVWPVSYEAGDPVYADKKIKDLMDY